MSSELEKTTWLSNRQSQGRLPAAEDEHEAGVLSSDFQILLPAFFLCSTSPTGRLLQRTTAPYFDFFWSLAQNCSWLILSHSCTRITLWVKQLFVSCFFSPSLFAPILSLIRLCSTNLNKPSSHEIGLLFLAALLYTFSFQLIISEL